MFFACGALAQEPPPLTDEQILSRSLTELKELEGSRQLDQYNFTKRISAENYDKNGKMTSHDEREYEFVRRPDGRYDVRLLSVKGAPPSEKELKQHDQAMRKELSKSLEQFAEEKKKAQEDDLMMSRDFLEYFDFKVSGREEWNGIPTFVIEFMPKADLSHLKEKRDRILRNMTGHMWVKQTNFRILATEMHSMKGIKVWGGISGIDHLISRMEYFQDADGIYLPSMDSAQWEIRVMLTRLGFSRKVELSKFSKAEFKPAAHAAQP